MQRQTGETFRNRLISGVMLFVWTVGSVGVNPVWASSNETLKPVVGEKATADLDIFKYGPAVLQSEPIKQTPEKKWWGLLLFGLLGGAVWAATRHSGSTAPSTNTGTLALTLPSP